MTLEKFDNKQSMKQEWDRTWDTIEDYKSNPVAKSKALVGKETALIEPKPYDQHWTQSTIKSVKDETTISSVNQNTAAAKIDYTQAMVDHLIVQTESELQKGDNADHEKIFRQVRQLVVLLMHKAGVIDHDTAFDKSQEVFVEVKKLKDSYNNWLSLTVTVVFAGVQIASGGLGIGGAFAGAGEAFKNIVAGLGSVGGAGNIISQLVNQRTEGNRVIIQFTFEDLKRIRDVLFENQRKDDNSKAQGIQSADQGEYLRHKMFGEQTGSTS